MASRHKRKRRRGGKFGPSDPASGSGDATNSNSQSNSNAADTNGGDDGPNDD